MQSMKGYDALVKAMYDATAKQQWLVEHVPRVMIGIINHHLKGVKWVDTFS